jgi:23S rRNA (pseudouridine1915-N3)-methyltransferase
MIQIRSISDGDKHFETGIQEYVKRMGKDIQIVNIKPSKKNTAQQIIDADTCEVVKRLKNLRSGSFFVVMLSKEGKQWTTDQRKDMIEMKKNKSLDIIFIIGGPYGLREELLDSFIDCSLCFGGVTMPHGLVKLVVLEQIYRCFQIISGKSYHY